MSEKAFTEKINSPQVGIKTTEKELGQEVEDPVGQLWEVNVITSNIFHQRLNPVEKPIQFTDGVKKLIASKELLERSMGGGIEADVSLAFDTLSNFFRYFDSDTGYPIQSSYMEEKTAKRIEAFLDFGVGCLHKNFGKAEEVIKGGGVWFDKVNAFRAVVFMARVSGVRRYKEKLDAIDFLMENFERFLISGKEFIETNLVPFTIATPVIPTILDETYDLKLGEQMIISLLKSPDLFLRRIACHGLTDCGANLNREVAEVISTAFGIDGKQAIKAWELAVMKKAPTYRTGDASFLENLPSLANLEAQRHGIGKVLQEEFGINDFARYPEELLIEQYDTRNRSDLPYGVIINPWYDHNGAFYGNTGVWQILFKALLL